MTLVDKHGRVITRSELAAEYARDLRDYSALTAKEIEERLWERYPEAMRAWGYQR